MAGGAGEAAGRRFPRGAGRGGGDLGSTCRNNLMIQALTSMIDVTRQGLEFVGSIDICCDPASGCRVLATILHPLPPTPPYFNLSALSFFSALPVTRGPVLDNLRPPSWLPTRPPPPPALMCGTMARPDGLADGRKNGRASIDMLRESLRKCRSHGDLRLAEYLEAAGGASRRFFGGRQLCGRQGPCSSRRLASLPPLRRGRRVI